MIDDHGDADSDSAEVPRQDATEESVPVQEPAGGEDVYGGESITILEGVDAIRKRPAMYIGSTSTTGLHHLVYEVIDNSIDEAMAGHCTQIKVRLNLDGSVTVSDNGRGIPTEIHSERGVSALEVVLTNIHSGGKFDKKSYKVSGGLHGVGITAVNALSEWLKADVRRDGKKYQIECQRGVPLGPVHEIGPANNTGTRISFKPDAEIFPETKFKATILEGRIRELAFLNPGVSITLIDEETGKEELFHCEDGLVGFVAHLNKSESVLHPDVISASGSKEIESGADAGVVELHVALQYNLGYSETVLSYCNNINTIDGGTHVSGFRNALTRTMNNYGKSNNLFKGDKTPSGEDFREGLAAVISVRVPNPQFGGQTKTRLGNAEIEGIVSSICSEQLSRFLEENPKVARRIIDKGLLAAEAREASRKAREMARQRKGALISDSLPGKLFDCIEKDARKCEVFLVEGDSAGGTAVGGRDRNIQAVLPLKGKILNVEKARIDRVLANDEIVNIIKAVGIGVGKEIDLEKRNYEKIVIMTDADVDGSHIRTLLLTFFYRQMPELVMAGHVYVAQPPLYLVRRKKEFRYMHTEEEMRQELLRLGMDGAAFECAGKEALDSERLNELVVVLASLENALQTLERRGLTLREFFKLREPESGLLPSFEVRSSGEHRWFHTSELVEEYLEEQRKRRSVPGVEGSEPKDEPDDAVAGVQVVELHEVRSINRGLKALESFGLGVDDLLPIVPRPGEEPEPRYLLANGSDNREPLDTIRDLVAALRRSGEKGYDIKRFKGLGEMDDEELWNTTMDPSQRLLKQVTVENVAAADEMFRVLMGEQVEPRRNFIDEHALEVRSLDYHA